jgi:hypothetical protein
MAPPERSVSQHDRDLLASFRALLPQAQKEFLRDHDFGGSFCWESLKGIRELADRWRGAEYEFDNPEVQKHFQALTSFASDWTHDLAIGSWIISIDQWASTIPELERNQDISKGTYDKIKHLNEGATKLGEDIDAFIRFARQRIAD